MRQQNQFDQRTVLTLLDVFGSCVTDVFYNHIYDRAVAIHEKTSSSVTNCYRNAVVEYVGESNTARFYTVLINSLHHYVKMSTIYNGITYSDCVSLYASLFVPQMYIKSMTAEQKINILSMIIKNTVDSFAKEILDTHIGGIIDDHNDPINVEVLQDAILKILLRERDLSFKKFIQSQQDDVDSSKKPTSNKPSAPTKLPTQTLNKLTTAFKKSVNDRISLQKKNVALSKKNKQLATQFKELKKMFLNQIQSQKSQTKLVDDLKEQLEQLKLLNKQSSESETQTSDVEINFQNTIMNKDDKANENEDDDDLFKVQYIES